MFSTIYTREDINALGMEDGAQLARAGGNSSQGHIDDSCPAIIDGGPQTMPLWAIDAADIEAMETYAPKPRTGAVTSINGNRRISTQQPAQANGACAGVRVYVWLRK